ncbi:MAG TPA: PepSY-associated TM helix domain-containing protein [Luteolibacter sp.]|nr:PepSY-associated TM helix domain-containing protein [Luteolibacter sp.]
MSDQDQPSAGQDDASDGSLRGKRRARPWHRLLGVVLAVPLVWVSVTGALLNHSADWGLDQRLVDHPLVLRAYGMSPKGIPLGIELGQLRIAQWDGQVFFNERRLDLRGIVVGAVADGQGVVLATADEVQRFDAHGERIEKLGAEALPATPLTAMVAGQDGIHLQCAGAWHRVSADWLEFTPSTPALAAQPLREIADDAWRDRLGKAWTQGGLPVSRVILDLHTARFLGPFGRYFTDFMVLCTLILCGSGLVLFFRKPRRAR